MRAVPDHGAAEQRAGRAFAEAGGEQRGTAHLLGDRLVDLVGLEDEQFDTGGMVGGVGQPDHDAVIGCGGCGIDAESLA